MHFSYRCSISWDLLNKQDKIRDKTFCYKESICPLNKVPVAYTRKYYFPLLKIHLLLEHLCEDRLELLLDYISITFSLKHPFIQTKVLRLLILVYNKMLLSNIISQAKVLLSSNQ